MPVRTQLPSSETQVSSARRRICSFIALAPMIEQASDMCEGGSSKWRSKGGLEWPSWVCSRLLFTSAFLKTFRCRSFTSTCLFRFPPVVTLRVLSATEVTFFFSLVIVFTHCLCFRDLLDGLGFLFARPIQNAWGVFLAPTSHSCAVVDVHRCPEVAIRRNQEQY